MQTLKKWMKTGDNSFTFWDDNKQIGTMEIALGTLNRKATAIIEDRTMVFARKGLWRSNIELTDEQGEIIAEIYVEKWYAHSYILEYGNMKYKLLVRNNPLAEWVVQLDSNDLLSYGLSTHNGKAVVKITTASNQPDYLFDFILWYLFVPLASEQGADDFTPLLLFTA